MRRLFKFGVSARGGGDTTEALAAAAMRRGEGRRPEDQAAEGGAGPSDSEPRSVATAPAGRGAAQIIRKRRAAGLQIFCDMSV